MSSWKTGENGWRGLNMAISFIPVLFLPVVRVAQADKGANCRRRRICAGFKSILLDTASSSIYFLLRVSLGRKLACKPVQTTYFYAGITEAPYRREHCGSRGLVASRAMLTIVCQLCLVS